MKNLSFLLAAALLHLASFAQKNNVQTAYTMLEQGYLDEARKYIDMAHANELTANDYKMWYYRGKIYLKISEDTGQYKNLDPNAPEKSFESFLNYIKTDDKKWYEDEVLIKDRLLFVSAFEVYDAAISRYREGNFEEAIRLYEVLGKVFEQDKDQTMKRNNVTREILYQNSYYACLQLKDNTRAKQYLQKLIDMGFNDPRIYLDMTSFMLAEKDTAKALEYIDKGRKIFYDNVNLIVEEARLYSAVGRTAELLTKYTDGIANDPYYDLLYISRGTIYLGTGEQEKAEADFLKALELNPASFDAAYQAGALYYNRAKAINDQMSDPKLPQQKYDALKQERDAFFGKSLEMLEKAIAVSPEDLYTMILLKEIYARNGDFEKSKMYRQKIAEIQAKVNQPN